MHTRLATLFAFALALTVAPIRPASPQRPAERAYSVDELTVLNGIGGFGDVGVVDADRDAVAPGNKLDFSVLFEFMDRPGEPTFWSVRQGFPPGQDVAQVDGLEFDLRVRRSNRCNLALYLVEPTDNRWVCWTGKLDEQPRDGWVHIAVKRPQMGKWKLASVDHDWDTISAIGIEASSGSATFNLDNVRLTRSTGAPIELFSPTDDGWAPLPGPAPALQGAPSAGRAFFPFDQARFGDPAMRLTPPGFAEIFGPVGVPLAGVGPGLPGHVRRMRALGLPVIAYSTFGSGYTRTFTRRGAWDANLAGTSLNTMPGPRTGWDFQHTYAAAHPAVFEAQKHRIDALISAGISTWMVVDYTFPWMGAPWGYSDAMVKAFRDDLSGLDEGLHVVSKGRTRVMRFADYFREHNGFTPKPADLGLTDWAQFTPPGAADTDAKRGVRQTLFLYLRSYEWLKLPDRVGRHYRSRGGQPLWIVPNPEDSWGSSDYRYLIRSAGVGNLFPEWFGCIGSAAEAGYASLPSLREDATDAGHRLSIIQETGAGGHSAPYLDWRPAYNGVYALAAAGRMDDLDNDFLDEATLEQMRSPDKNPTQFNRFRDGAAKALAFRQAVIERPMRPRARILCVTETPPARSCGSVYFKLDQPHTLAVGLSRAHLVFDLRDGVELERVLPRYDVVAYSPWAARVGDLALLRRWLQAKPGRVLVTHSFVPTRDTREYGGTDPSMRLGVAGGGPALGLGSIAAGTPASEPVTWAQGGWASALPLGADVKALGALAATTAGRPLVRCGKRALVSEARVGKGRVIYLHYTPGDGEAVQQVDAAVLREVCRQAGVPSTCRTDFGASVQRFGVAGGQSVVAWDTPAMSRWTFRYEPGIAPMEYADPTVNRTVHVAAGPGVCLVYDFWNDTMRRARPEGGSVGLAMKGAVTSLWYVGEDTSAFRRTVGAARALRGKMRSMGFG
jgi:hypothetical protein